MSEHNNPHRALVFTGLFLGAVGLVVGGLAFKKAQDLEAAVTEIPPVVIVDFARLAMSYPKGISPEQLEQLMLDVNNSIVRLSDAGYLILDAQYVVGAPADLYLPIPDFQAKAQQGEGGSLPEGSE